MWAGLIMTKPAGKKQACRHALMALVLIALGFSLSACGKKPSAVDPPPDVTEDHFPRVYPDSATDPKP
jgi:predicted small lipoprotein YifL